MPTVPRRERVTYDGDDNALTITNTGAGDVYADLFGDGVDKSVVSSLFTAAGRGQTDMVLSFTVTNTGEAAAQYKVVVSNGKTFFEVEVVPEYDEYNEPTGGTTTATPTLEPGESRYIEIAASAMLADYTGDFTAQLVLCGAGELTYSGFTLRKGSYVGSGSVPETSFNDLTAMSSNAVLTYDTEVYDRSYLAVTTAGSYAGVAVTSSALEDFMSETTGYMRWLVHNPNDSTLRMVFQHRGPHDTDGDRFGAVGNSYHPSSRRWEISFAFNVPANGYREFIVPRSYLGSSCNDISLWVTDSGVRFDVLEFGILSDTDLAGIDAYDFSQGLPALTDGEGTPVDDGSATIERVTYDGDDNALEITNASEGSVRANLFGDSVDKTAVTDFFTAAGRGQTDGVLSFTVTNTGDTTA